jgi:hypothetical protein
VLKSCIVRCLKRHPNTVLVPQWDVYFGDLFSDIFYYTSSGKQNAEEDSEGISEEDSNEKHARRTFCPPEHRQSIVDMLERHYCAHPSIPGYAAPNPVAIKRWAVQQMYRFCIRNEIPEVWAYLWENWYREGRWNLWARSAHKLIPMLKTTMILESQ